MMRTILPLLVILAGVLPAMADAVDVVPEGYEDVFWHNAAIGGLFIALYTYGRFNTPPTSRSSTTALRYYIGVAMYVLSALAVYALIANNPALAVWFLDHIGLGTDAHAASFPLLLALMMTSSVEVISPVAKLDEFLRERFHRLASIPYRAKRLSEQLVSSPLFLAEPLRARVLRELQQAGLEEPDLDGRDPTSRRGQWVRLAVLVSRLRQWRNVQLFEAYCGVHGAEVAVLEQRYETLLQQARIVFPVLGHGDDGDATADPVLHGYRASLAVQVETTLEATAELMSHGILECGRTERARVGELETIGVACEHEGLSTDQRIAVLLVIAAMLTLFIVVLNRQLPLSERISLGIGASLSNWLAVLWAIEPRERRWALALPDRPDFRPVTYYLVVGVGALGSGLIVRAFARVTSYGSFSGSIAHAGEWAAWSLLDMATAVMIAVHIDNAPRRGLRWIEGATQAVVSMAIVWVVAQIGIGTVATSLPQLMLRTGFFGFVLGTTVPTWSRTAPRPNSTSTVDAAHTASRRPVHERTAA